MTTPEDIERAQKLAKEQGSLVITDLPEDPDKLKLPESCVLKDSDARAMGLSPTARQPQENPPDSLKDLPGHGISVPFKELPKDAMIRGPKYGMVMPRYQVPEVKIRTPDGVMECTMCPSCKQYVPIEHMTWENEADRIPNVCKMCIDNPPTNAEDRESHKLGFFAYEKPAGEVEDISDLTAKLVSDDDCERYFGSQGAYFLKPGMGSGYTHAEILQDLWGMKLCNAVLAYVQGFNPSKIRITTGECTTDACHGRVTIYVEPLFEGGPRNPMDPSGWAVVKIEQEIDCGYGCGYDVDRVTRAIKEGKEPPKASGPSVFGNAAALKDVDFS